MVVLRGISGRRETLGAVWAGLALSRTIAKAVVIGVFCNNKPFFRRPECEDRPRLVQALLSALEETILAPWLISAASGVVWLQGGDLPGARPWGAALLVQSLPYLAVLGMGLVSSLSGRRQLKVAPAAKPASQAAPT